MTKIKYQSNNRKTYLLILCLFIFIPSISIELYAQEQKVSLPKKQMTIKSAFDEIRKQTQMTIAYNEAEVNVNKSVSLNIINKTVKEALTEILEGTGYSFKIQGRQIVIIPSNYPTDNTRKYTGKIIDVYGDPIIGANITVKSTRTGTISDADGKFTISAKEGSLLVISYIGYITQEVRLGANLNLMVTLKENIKELDDVVVVGYGTQKKVNLTGSVSSVSSDLLKNRPVSSVGQGLQGLVPNLNITFHSGQPNTPAQVNIRGNTSINGGSALVLVDGVETDISLINPEDIENVSVLKDASSAAIYGARGAFGVLLVTTKQGSKNQKTKINYSNNLSWSKPARLPKMPRSDVWARAWNAIYDYEAPGSYYFNDKFLEALDAHIADPRNNPDVLVDIEAIQSPNHTPSNPGWAYVGNTDWLKEFYKDAAFMQQHNINISGGSEKNKYYVSLGLKDQEGVFRYGNDEYKRFNLSMSFESEITKWLDLGFTAKYNWLNNNQPHLGRGDSAETWYYEVYRMYPTLPIYLPNGDFAGLAISKGNQNVIGSMALAGRDIASNHDMWYTGRFDFHPIKNLSVKGNYTLNKYFSRQKMHKKAIYQTMPEGVPPMEREVPNGVTNINRDNTYHAVNIWGQYDFNLKEQHNFSVMVGYNHESQDKRMNRYQKIYLASNELPISNTASEYAPDGDREEDQGWRVQGAFFRLNYDYNSKYLLEVNGRYDGSSKFRSGHRGVFVPSMSLGWRISEEQFFSPLREVVDNLKFRGGYGIFGNQVVESNFGYLAYLRGVSMKNYMMDGQPIMYLSNPTLPDHTTWEKVYLTNFGIDWSLFKNRLTGSFDYYKRNTKDMIRSIKLPAVLGTSGGKENLSDMVTKGWELEVSWNDKFNNVLGSPLQYSITAGLSDYQAEITNHDNPTGALSDYYKGYKMGQILGYVTDGYIMDDAEAKKMNYIQSFISNRWWPGDIRYKDLNEDGFINSGKSTLDDPGDRVVIGNNTPRYKYNFQGSFKWKGFDFWIMFEGVGKRDLWTSSDQFWGFSRGIYNANVTQYHMDNTWTPDNPNAYFPRPTSGNNRNMQVQSKYLLDASYIRLKNLTIGYEIPKSWAQKLYMDQLRVYVSAYNLWEKTHMPPHLTPDVMDTITGQISSVNSVGSVNSGKVYAFMRSFSFGLSVTF